MKSIFKILFMLLILHSCMDKPKNTVTDSSQRSELVEQGTIQSLSIDITNAKVLGKFNYKTDSCFVLVDSKFSSKPIYLERNTYAAFLEMYRAAQSDGIDLKIISGTRNFDEQKRIWNRKWKRYSTLKPIERAKKILEYSSMPTTSRHHWGTDIDLNNLNNSYFNGHKGQAEYRWLTTHAKDYGFYQVYTTKAQGRTGYEEEKWHWSYLPLAQPYLDFYNNNITFDDIKGFDGAELAKELHIIVDFVNGISEEVKGYKK